MTFKNAFTQIFCARSVKVSKLTWEASNHLFQVDIADNLFQSSFALRFQGPRNQDSIFLQAQCRQQSRVESRYEWSERAARRGILVDTAQSTYSLELGDGDTEK